MQVVNKERWQELCERASAERDPAKLLELIREINHLLDEKSARLGDSKNNLHPSSDQVKGGGVVQETIIFSGTIIGEGQRVECQVRATKTTLDGDPPLFSGYRIMESDLTDRLPDGDYELLVNRERTRFSRDAGRFLSRPY